MAISRSWSWNYDNLVRPIPDIFAWGGLSLPQGRETKLLRSSHATGGTWSFSSEISGRRKETYDIVTYKCKSDFTRVRGNASCIRSERPTGPSSLHDSTQGRATPRMLWPETKGRTSGGWIWGGSIRDTVTKGSDRRSPHLVKSHSASNWHIRQARYLGFSFMRMRLCRNNSNIFTTLVQAKRDCTPVQR